MPSPTLYIRELWCRDDSGHQRMVRIETRNPDELVRIAGRFREMENRSRGEEKTWLNGHATFTDAEIKPDLITDAVGAKENPHGFPWDPDDEHYAFALLIGEGLVGYAPSGRHQHTEEGRDGRPDVATYGNEVMKGGHCPLHNGAPLPIVACCLVCCRTGRDVAIPRPTTRDLKARHDRMPAWKPPEATKLPAPLRDKMGRALKGGLCGKP